MDTFPLLDQLIFAASILALIYIAGFVLRSKPKAYYFFITSYFILAFSLFLNYISFTGIILKYPHLFRIGSPLQYLIGPSSYFFVLLTLKPNTKLKFIHLLHLLPFVLHTLELIPFYISDEAEKRAFLYDIHKNALALWNAPDGLFLSYRQHIMIKFSIMAVYIVLQWKLIYSYKRKWHSALKQTNSILLEWIRFDTFIKTLLNIFILISVFLVHRNLIFTFLPSVFVIADLVLGLMYTLLYPSILTGIQPAVIDFGKPEPNHTYSADTADQKEEGYDDLQDLPVYKSDAGQKEKVFLELETYMQTEQPFLDENLSRLILAKKMHMPARKLSEMIKRETGLSFSDYVNAYRINYIEAKLLADNRWKEYTIEAMAIQAGFNTRAAYNNSLKRLKDETPTELLKRFEHLT